MSDQTEAIETAAREIMEDAARQITAADIRRLAGGGYGTGEMSDAEYDEFVSAVTEAIERAAIEITF